MAESAVATPLTGETLAPQDALGESAYIRVPTWGIVVDGMPARNVDMSEEFKRELIACNAQWAMPGFEFEIAHVGWLAKPRGYSGSLVVEFTNPVVANNALRGGTMESLMDLN
ncbi:Hypothetical protein PENO1_108460 [Penicillium occitanis (nom. inval.)]|nr:Hypothetical protein PENO1_108460 [Penicillium occitanis (nom. inval.)]PCG88923.1 hypothetical protein PENOC_108830 [Penicillium occitanis (nom. inval.)]